MPRDPLIDALRAEIEVALAATRAARKIIADIERGERAAEKARQRTSAAGSDAGASLRMSGMTVAEAARVLGVPDDRVRVMLRKNQLRGVEFGGRVGWRLDRQDVHEKAEQLEAQRRGRTLARDAASRERPPG